MLTVACVLRSGGIYTPEWPQRLQRQVEANLSQDHNFVCLSDMEVEGVETIGLRHDWPGWWSKIELFEPGLFGGPVLYLDLDCVVVGRLDDLFDYDGFTMCSDFLRPQYKNSSVMAWHKPMHRLYDAFRPNPAGWMQKYDRQRPQGRIGDQAFIEDHAGDIDVFLAGKVVSYKKDCKASKPKHASVVAFHGRPKPDAVGGWVAEIWNG